MIKLQLWIIYTKNLYDYFLFIINNEFYKKPKI